MGKRRKQHNDPNQEQIGFNKPNEEIHRFVIQHDGGSSPNPGNSYGSYRITKVGGEHAGKWHEEIGVEFGHGTNNEAELNSLLAGLEKLVELLVINGEFPLNESKVFVRTDSMLVTYYLRSPAMKKMKPHLVEIGKKIHKILKDFHSYTWEWIPRIENVRIFGH